MATLTHQQEHSKFNAHPDPIANALDLTPNTSPLVASEPKPVDVPNNGSTEKDVEYAREDLYHLAERGRDALEELMELANQSQHPRSFEVVADLVRTLSGANKDLLDIQKKMKDMDPDKHKPQKVENNLFIGSTKELTDLLDGGARKVPTTKKKDVDS